MEKHLSDPKVNNSIERSQECLDKFTSQLKIKRAVTKKMREYFFDLEILEEERPRPQRAKTVQFCFDFDKDY